MKDLPRTDGGNLHEHCPCLRLRFARHTLLRSFVALLSYRPLSEAVPTRLWRHPAHEWRYDDDRHYFASPTDKHTSPSNQSDIQHPFLLGLHSFLYISPSSVRLSVTVRLSSARRAGVDSMRGASRCNPHQANESPLREVSYVGVFCKFAERIGRLGRER